MKEGRSQQLTKGDTVEEEKSEMSRAAEALLLEERTDHSAGPTVHPQKRKVEDVSTDEEAILLPRWQQELPKEEGVTADGKRTLSSISSSSEFLQQESTAHQMQQWQSVTSAFESSSSISENKRVQQTELPATTAGGCGEQFNTALDISSHEDNTAVYRKEIYPLHGAASKPAQEEPSLSPSSLAADPFNVVEVSKTDTQESLAAVAGPTQPDLSEDLFRPSVTLHGSQGASHKEDISGTVLILFSVEQTCPNFWHGGQYRPVVKFPSAHSLCDKTNNNIEYTHLTFHCRNDYLSQKLYVI